MAFIPKPQFPNVPRLPGVPQVLRSPILPASPGPILGAAAAIGALWRGLFARPKWGVFKQPSVRANDEGIETVTVIGDLQPVIECDSVLDFGYRNEVDIPDFPIQDGSFANYNRVNLPYEATVRLVKGGSEEDRRNFLAQIDAVMGTTDLFQIITPERVYENVNATRIEIQRRGASGAYYLTEVDLFFREIKTVSAQYTTTGVATFDAQNPSARPPQNLGTVNPERPDPPPVIENVVTE